jgi:hypothetical protein
VADRPRTPEQEIRWRSAVLMVCDLLELDMKRAALAAPTPENDRHE